MKPVESISRIESVERTVQTPSADDRMVVQLNVGELRQLIIESVQQALNQSITRKEDDRLLTVEEAAKRLNVKPRWLYRRADKLPFARRLSRKALRFSESALLRWQSAKKPFQTP